MVVLIPFIVLLPLLGFWFWMYQDMTHNVYLSDQSRYYWTLAFVFMNVFGAVWYYVAEYRNRY